MAFFTRKNLGRVYVIRMTLPDSTIVHKVGMCHSSRSTDRMLELLRSWFMHFRSIPYTVLKLDMESQNALKLEQYVHSVLSKLTFEPYYDVEGRTEMFTNVDEDRLLHFIKAAENTFYPNLKKLSTEESKILTKLLIKN